jgi:hypothetical protein
MYRFTITVTCNLGLNADVLKQVLSKKRPAFLFRHRIAWSLEKTVNEAIGKADIFRYPVESVAIERVAPEGFPGE